ncbi:MAG TPA: 1,4-alpha-glucan branching protein domain-containing protein [Sumerlaeia bacterium]|nr:1,4-alpha-glucan branching protein domain-containing protein [Sumerlaeia bacterium]
MANHNPKGYLCLALHAHLPFVRHPEYDDPLEEHWLYEAITETYIPLVAMMERLVDEGVRFRLTMSITPPLATMLADDLLRERYLRHLEGLLELAHKEIWRTRREAMEFHACALMYRSKLEEALDVFRNRCQCDLLRAFRSFQDRGVLEIVTCSATHGFLPLFEQYPNAIRAQIAVGRQSYAEHFGRPPRGIWNAECGYYQGLDRFLAEQEIRFFFTDTHAALCADRRPVYGVFAPVFCPSGVAAFARDAESSKSVWSSEEGYPGDFDYREFYRDVGFDLPFDYVAPYIHESGTRISTGLKYYRITGRPCGLGDKQPYNPDVAAERVHSHAGNFMFNRERQIEHLASLMDRPPIIVSPYDAELFGHWWYEGPAFLESLLRKIHYDSPSIEPITPSEYLERHPANQVATPSFSTWGDKGYCEVWLEGSNDWVYRHLHKATERMIDLANKNRWETDPIRLRMLNQGSREVLLAQSSDWAFIMKTQTTVGYAVHRTTDHLQNFRDLWRMLEDGTSNIEYLESLESRHNIFPNIDFRVFADPL